LSRFLPARRDPVGALIERFWTVISWFWALEIAKSQPWFAIVWRMTASKPL
jgi:hypothetical protein